MDRIEILRKQPLENMYLSDAFHYHFYKSYSQLEHLNFWERYAQSYYDAFNRLTPSITEGELIVGKRNIPLSPEAAAEWESTYKSIANDYCRMTGGGQDSHMAIDYELVLHHGLYGIIDQIDHYLPTASQEQIDFYNTCKCCLEAVIRHSENYAQTALAMSVSAEGALKEELLEVARICNKVPAHPAETFHEAVQSAQFITYCLTMNPFCMGVQQFQLGHPDRFLLPYYEKDLANGTLTKERAQLLLDLMGIQINNRLPNGFSCGYMVGGRDPQGHLVANDLTSMGMQVIDDIRLVYPAVGLCYTDDMPFKYLEQACELLLKGHTHPAIFNDDIIAKGLLHYGLSEEESRNYIHSNCVEITPVAASNVWVASPYTNMAQLLLDCMDQEYNSIEDLIATLLHRLDLSIEKNFHEQNHLRHIRADRSINPLLSCVVNDCLAKGVDIEQGGGRYNWIMPSFVGMANLVDSLYAIRHLVYEQKRFTIAEFRSILDADFQDHEDLRQYILNKIAKYGNDNDDVDSYFTYILDHIVQECTKYTGMHSNGNLIPSFFCWINHERMGVVTGATPDGRKAGFPLGDGSGPCQGREMQGPTASIISSTKWDHYPLIGGVAVNLKFSKASLGTHSMTALQALIKTYMKRGGFELQINVTDNSLLEKARQHPESYRDLLVRIGGYSDYFVTLTPEMQAEVMMRTTHIL